MTLLMTHGILHKLMVGPLLHNGSSMARRRLQDNNKVSILDCAEAMSNNQRCSLARFN